MIFCKKLLGVKTQATNIGVLLDLGEIPLSISATRDAIKTGLEYVTILGATKMHIRKTYHRQQNIKRTLSQIGMLDTFLPNDVRAGLKTRRFVTLNLSPFFSALRWSL